MKTLPVITLFAWMLSGLTLQAEDRVWTNVSGKKITATLLGVQGDKVNLKTTDGKTYLVPLGTLSEEDRSFVEKWVSEEMPDTSKDVLKEPKPAVGSKSMEWPTSVDNGTDIKVTTVKEDGTENIYRTEHFEFHSESRLGGNVIRECARIFESTFSVVDALPLNLEPKPAEEYFITRLFDTREGYMSAGGLPGSAGVYIGRTKEILIPIESLGVKRVGKRFTIDHKNEDFSTLIHELTHQMMHEWLNKIPVWVAEGSAQFVECARYNNGRFNFARHSNFIAGMVQSGRMESRDGFVLTDLEALVTMTHEEWAGALTGRGKFSSQMNYGSAALLFNYFCRLDGKGDGKGMIDYFAAIKEGKTNEEAFEAHLLRGREYSEIKEDLIKAYRRLGLTILE